MEPLSFFTIVILPGAFLALYFGEGIFVFLGNLISCLISLALTLLAVVTVVVAIAIVLHTAS